MLIIAHRLSAVRQCDRILTLDKGRIDESDMRDELLRLCGRYAALHYRQIGVRAGPRRERSPNSGQALTNDQSGGGMTDFVADV